MCTYNKRYIILHEKKKPKSKARNIAVCGVQYNCKIIGEKDGLKYVRKKGRDQKSNQWTVQCMVFNTMAK